MIRDVAFDILNRMNTQKGVINVLVILFIIIIAGGATYFFLEGEFGDNDTHQKEEVNIDTNESDTKDQTATDQTTIHDETSNTVMQQNNSVQESKTKAQIVAANAFIRSKLNSLDAYADLYASNNQESYVGVCASTDIVTVAKDIADFDSVLHCADASNTWMAYAQLQGSDAEYYCVGNEGSDIYIKNPPTGLSCLEAKKEELDTTVSAPAQFTGQRAQAANKAMEATFQNFRAAAELYYDSNLSSFENLCESREFELIRIYLQEEFGIAPTCRADSTQWIAYVPQFNSTPTMYCVDSRGSMLNLSVAPSGFRCF